MTSLGLALTGEPEPAESAAERAYREIRDQLVTLVIRPGEPIRDEPLGAALGVGRTPVREALKRLERDRLVVSYARRGTFAAEVNLTDLKHIAEVRLELEPLAAGLAAERATVEERAALLTMLPLKLAAGDAQSLIQVDLALHRRVYALTHNPYLEDSLNYYDNLATRIWCLYLNELPDMEPHVREHETLLRAIASGQPNRARRIVKAHVEQFEQVVRSLI